ncbi:hypothetical protein EIM50_19210 [Pseudoxanthomonas sp. SGD-10]|nr:hypothetical protein EIM50_19210 [Pseudoxanthomonas sp. SGD-10]
MNLKQQLTAHVILMIFLGFPSLSAQEPVVKDSVKIKEPVTSKKEEANRNVMLNAESNSGPRFIQIGIPTGSAVDVPTILENDMPAVYYFFPRNPNSFWRASSGLSNIGVLKISEVAITTGRVGYGVNSYTRKGQDKFAGLANYGVNHFGMQRFDINLSGKLAKDLNYSASVYQMFDPGSAKLPFSELQDRTAIYTGTLSKYFHNRKGELSLTYRKSRLLQSFIIIFLHTFCLQW